MTVLGKPYTRPGFADYISGLTVGKWRPSLIVIHHCAAPSLAQRPVGFAAQHMVNLREFYEGKGWSAGPHLFVDDDQVWTFSPLTAPGIHAVSFNRNSVGIEMLGDYDTEDPWSGRGLQVLTTTCHALLALLRKFGLTPAAIRFHRDDPKTSKSCPGTKLDKAKFLNLLQSIKP